MEDVSMYIIWTFGLFWSYDMVCNNLVYFMVIWYIFPFWYFAQIKIWQPWYCTTLSSPFLQTELGPRLRMLRLARLGFYISNTICIFLLLLMFPPVG
jgi:hypothetical protein